MSKETIITFGIPPFGWPPGKPGGGGIDKPWPGGLIGGADGAIAGGEGL